MKTLFRIICICTFAVLGVFGCGGDDCPVCPEPECTDCRYDGRLYVAMNLTNPGIYIFDTKSDSLIDSIVASSTVGDLSLSATGDYFAFIADIGVVKIFRATSLDLFAELPISGSGRFAGSSQVFVLRDESAIRILEFPSLTPVGSIDLPFSSFMRIPNGASRLFSVQYPDSLFELDLDSARIIQAWWIKLAAEQYLKLFDVSSDRSMLYGLANTTEGDVFYAYDLIRDTVIFKFHLFSDFGDVRVHPDGGEVWVTDPGSPFVYPWPDEVYVFDAKSGAHLYSISLRQSLNPFGAIPDAYSLEFTPDGSAAYIRTGSDLSISGTVLRIDCRTKKVTNVLFPHWDRYPISMAVGQKPKLK